MVPFYDSPSARTTRAADRDHHSQLEDTEYEEAEAESWILQAPNNNNNNKSVEHLFSDVDDPYVETDNMVSEQKPCNNISNIQLHHQEYKEDGVVPHVQNKINNEIQLQGPVVDGYPTYGMDFSAGSKPFMYNFSTQSISQSVSSSSMEVGVVPDHNTMTDVSNTFVRNSSIDGSLPNPISSSDREARVLRYREKRKNRKFQKTIRYASRKAYAETRPRIKGRFAKRTENDAIDSLVTASDASYGVVPSF